MPRLMDEGFKPKTVGRPLAVDATPLLEMAKANPGRWVCESYPERQALSVRRQLLKKGLDARSVKAEKPGYRQVIVRYYKEEQK